MLGDLQLGHFWGVGSTAALLRLPGQVTLLFRPSPHIHVSCLKKGLWSPYNTPENTYHIAKYTGHSVPVLTGSRLYNVVGCLVTEYTMSEAGKRDYSSQNTPG